MQFLLKDRVIHEEGLLICSKCRKNQTYWEFYRKFCLIILSYKQVMYGGIVSLIRLFVAYVLKETKV